MHIKGINIRVVTRKGQLASMIQAAAVKMWMECKYARMMYMRARRMYMNEKSRNHHDQASESDVRRK